MDGEGTTARMQELEQRLERLPRATLGAKADDPMDGEGRATLGAKADEPMNVGGTTAQMQELGQRLELIPRATLGRCQGWASVRSSLEQRPSQSRRAHGWGGITTIT